LILGLIGLLGGGLASCSPGNDPAGGGDSPAPATAGAAKKYRIGVIPKGTTHVFWNYIHAGCLRARDALRAERGVDVEILWQGPEVEEDREGQRQVIEGFLAPDIAGLVLAPLDDQAMVGPVRQARAAGKPVVIIDSGLQGEAGKDFDSFVATDNYKGGVLAAEEMGRALDGKGKVLLLRYQEGSASTTQREQGFIDVLRSRFPGIELVPPGLAQYSGATAGKAQNVSETLLNQYSDAAGIFCPNESSTTGMLQALGKTPLSGKVKFIGFDANEKLIQALEDGRLHGLVLQNPVLMGELGVRTLVDVLEKKAVERRIDTGVFLITRANAAEPAMQKLLRPDLSILNRR
jgi:ribose transport system substrate-binding protein